MWRRAPTPLASLPTSQRGTMPSWERGHPRVAWRPSAHAVQAAAGDLDLGIDRITTGERLALAVSIRWLLTSHSRHLEEGTRTMADVAFSHRAEPHAPPNTMDHPGQWHYVATRLTAHMGTYGPDETKELHCLLHRRGDLRIRTAIQRHNIRAIPEPLQGHRRCV